MSCVRLRLDFVAEAMLTDLLNQIEAESQGLFVNQLNPHAGLGCRPYHVTLISGIRGKSILHVESELNTAASTWLGPLRGRITGWRMGGSVQLAVKVDGSRHVTDRLCNQIRSGRPFNSNQCPLRITAGRFTGQDENGFLATVNKRFPVDISFMAVAIEFEDDQGSVKTRFPLLGNASAAGPDSAAISPLVRPTGWNQRKHCAAKRHMLGHVKHFAKQKQRRQTAKQKKAQKQPSQQKLTGGDGGGGGKGASAASATGSPSPPLVPLVGLLI